MFSLNQKFHILKIVESSQILQRNVAFEIPALKKQINKCQLIREECHTRHAELDKNIHEIQKQYGQLCTEMSIKVLFSLILFIFYFIFL